MECRPVRAGRGCPLGGRASDPRDLVAGRLLETTGDEPGPLRELRRLDAPLGAVAPVAGSAGDWLAAVGTGVALLTGSDGYRRVADLESGNAAPARMNDAVADPHGRFWAGSMAM